LLSIDRSIETVTPKGPEIRRWNEVWYENAETSLGAHDQARLEVVVP
jgi:hypothetical protein